MKRLRRHFGTARGLVRLLLAYLELYTGRLDQFKLAHPERVRRLVFVCQGNICRSAVAARAAAGLGLVHASFGLATSTGAVSPAEACAAARGLGLDLSDHRALDLADFKALPGDLLLAMEVRQARALQRWLEGRDDVAVALLGLWCQPPLPHLHDPFTLDADYVDTCFRRVVQAVGQLGRAVPAVAVAVYQPEPAGAVR